MNVFDKAKKEIKEMIDLITFIQSFDHALLHEGFQPTKTSIGKRNKAEKRYVYLLKKYTQ